MTPAARIQAAIDLLDAIIAAARDGGPAADALARDFFRSRRYMGSGDRRAVRELVYRVIRRFGDRPASGRAAMVALADEEPELAAGFDGSGYAPEPILPDEPRAGGGALPAWLLPRLPGELDMAEQGALLERAPLDLRFNPRRTDAAAIRAVFPDAVFSAHLPYGFRLPGGTSVEGHPLWQQGAIEVQDWGSQAVALACGPLDKGPVIDLCAGAGGKTLALAAQLPPSVPIIACDVNRARLAQLEPRRQRAGADNVSALLLDPGKEAAALQPYQGQASLVLVDAPCSGTGTWRRNPETRWRLTPTRLERLLAEQRRLIGLAADLVRPGGRLVYAVCSILPEEGWQHIERGLCGREGWRILVPDMAVGRLVGPPGGNPLGRMFTPAHDGTDGFFLACAVKS